MATNEPRPDRHGDAAFWSWWSKGAESLPFPQSKVSTSASVGRRPFEADETFASLDE